MLKSWVTSIKWHFNTCVAIFFKTRWTAKHMFIAVYYLRSAELVIKLAIMLTIFFLSFPVFTRYEIPRNIQWDLPQLHIMENQLFAAPGLREVCVREEKFDWINWLPKMNLKDFCIFRMDMDAYFCWTLHTRSLVWKGFSAKNTSL